MAWAVFKNNRQVGKSFPTKLQAQTEANEKGYVLIAKGTLWYEEGVGIKEFKEERKPQVGDTAFSLEDGTGRIIGMVEGGRVNIYFGSNEEAAGITLHISELTWVDEENRWEYGDLERK